jgi:hypothetical protein
MIEELRTLAEKATPGRLETAQRHIAEEVIECPICNGDGEVYASDYCNIDGRALGVQFYGIGPEFGAHEALWSFLMANLPTILTALEALPVMREALEKIAGRPGEGIEYIPDHGDEVCSEARHMELIARAALASLPKEVG